MDPNPEQIVVVESSGRLALNLINTGGGPINKLPNEIMAHFLDKMKLKWFGDIDEDGDRYYYNTNELVKLRLVSKRWNSLVEDFCRPKKVLNVNYFSFFNPDKKISVPLFAELKTVGFFGTILKLFPNIVQLAVGFWSDLDDTQIRDFAVEINSLTSLKVLKFEGQTLAALPHLTQTLSKLEHIEVDDTVSCSFTKDDLLRFVSDLGPDCTVGVYLDEIIDMNFSQIIECHNINPHWFGSLKHLKMYCLGDFNDCAKVVHFLSEHATSLQFLTFYAWDHYLDMSPTVIRDLGKLVHLTKLKLWSVKIEIPDLEDTAEEGKLTSLPSVLSCELFVEWGFGRPRAEDNGQRLTRVLSTIFPNLTDFHLRIGEDFSTSERFLRQIEQSLNRFPNLRKHKIVFF